MSIHTEVHPAQGSGDGKPCVVLIHGAGDYCGRYEHVITALQEAGYGVVTGDLPGNGRTQGLQGHVESFDEYLDCVDEWVRQAQQLSADGRVALVGHSMGGLIAVRFLQARGDQHQEIVCAAVSSPLLKLVMEVPSWKQWLADRLNRWSPRLRLESGIAPQVISRTPEVVTAYANDPFCGGKVSVRWFQEINRGMAQAQADVKKIAVPLLVMQAGADQLVDPRQADVFFKSLQPHEEHEYTVYPECFHELFNEPEQQQVIDQLVKWLDARTATT